MEQIRRADREKILSGTDAFALMERAAEALAGVVAEQIPQGGDALFVCGGGNNGGDGFCAAEILRKKGFDVAVLCLAERFSDECARAKAAFRGEIYGRISKRRFAVLVDCLLGTGIDRAPEGDVKTLIKFINSTGSTVIACDLPSGLGENGAAFSPCVRADLTLAIGGLKNAHFLADGRDVCGEVRLAEIGLTLPTGAEIWEKEDVKKLFPKRKSHVNKGNFGAAAIFAGNPKYTGAAFLAAEACLRSGAGYTKLFAEEPFYSLAVGKLPSVVLQKYENDPSEFFLSDAIALGSGAGVSDELYQIIQKILSDFTGILLLDADALNALSRFGVGILKKKRCRVILTPHLKEFSRLTGKSVQEISQHAVEFAVKFAKDYGVCLVLKDNSTVITDGDRTAIIHRGSPALAKGGSGDVLCGFLAGTCARGVSPFEAACVACNLFGRAGELAAEKMGEYSSCASDVMGFLPSAILELFI